MVFEGHEILQQHLPYVLPKTVLDNLKRKNLSIFGFRWKAYNIVQLLVSDSLSLSYLNRLGYYSESIDTFTINTKYDNYSDRCYDVMMQSVSR